MDDDKKKTLEWLRVYLEKAYRRGEVGNPLEWEALAEELWREISTTLGFAGYVGIDPATGKDYSCTVWRDQTGKLFFKKP